MPTYISIISTKKEPIRFFLNYPKCDRNSLYQLYKRLDGYEGYFDGKKQTAFLKIDTQNDEDTFEEFTFEEFVRNKFDEEVVKSKYLITKLYKKNPNKIQYEKLLRAFVERYEKLKDYPHYPEYKLLPESLISIVQHAMHLYRMMFRSSLEKEVEKIIKGEEALTGKTDYSLKSHLRSKITELNSKLILAGYIDPDTKAKQWQQFFAGKYPDPRINWTKKPGELKNFIDQVACDKFMNNPPKQRYKLLPSIFKLDGIELKKDFNKNNNSCGKEAKTGISNMLNSLLP